MQCGFNYNATVEDKSENEDTAYSSLTFPEGPSMFKDHSRIGGFETPNAIGTALNTSLLAPVTSTYNTLEPQAFSSQITGLSRLPMTTGKAGLDIHAPASFDVNNLPLKTNQTFENAHSIPQTGSSDRVRAVMSANGGRHPNQIDFMFFDREVMNTQASQACKYGVSQVLASLEVADNGAKKYEHELPLQSFLVQQQLVAGIAPKRVRLMFSERIPDAERRAKKQIIVRPDGIEPNGIGAPKYTGSVPTGISDLRDSLMKELQTSAAEQKQLEEFYSAYFCTNLDPSPRLPEEHPEVSQQVPMNSEDNEKGNDDKSDGLRSLFEDDDEQEL